MPRSLGAFLGEKAVARRKKPWILLKKFPLVNPGSVNQIYEKYRQKGNYLKNLYFTLLNRDLHSLSSIWIKRQFF